jgi:hypothetical protein
VTKGMFASQGLLEPHSEGAAPQDTANPWPIHR